MGAPRGVVAVLQGGAEALGLVLLGSWADAGFSDGEGGPVGGSEPRRSLPGSSCSLPRLRPGAPTSAFWSLPPPQGL